jgi:hypothetical protein
MSSQRYKRLITNLPAMASAVNAFQSAEVQLSVYRKLVEAFDDAWDDDAGSSGTPRNGRSSTVNGSHGGLTRSRESGLADLVEGDSIHAVSVDEA